MSLIMANKEASTSRHPFFPQEHRILLSDRGIWLNSPAKPLWPVKSLLSTIIPKPTPQFRLITSVLGDSFANQNLFSAVAMALESFSTYVLIPSFFCKL